MSTLLNGSICLTDLIAHAKQQHSAFSKAKNGKIYCNISQWVNDEANEYGHHSSIILNSSKEMKDQEGKVYIGNAKKVETQSVQAVSKSDVEDLDDDLPF
jgi:hypothetical protein